MLVLPVAITLWVFYWIYSTLEQFIIEPLAKLVLWKAEGLRPDEKLPDWFEFYVAPLLGILLALALLYALGFFVNSRLRRLFDWILLRVPVVSVIYSAVGKVFQTLDRQRNEQPPQRVVLVAFPHPGMRVPAFVTATTRDAVTGKTLLCVYVPTTPVPTSGYFLLVPEEDVIELDWTPEQTLQTIISAGLTVPPEVRFFKPPSP